MTQVLSKQFRHLHSANNYITDADLVEEHNERNEAENTDLCEVCVEMLSTERDSGCRWTIQYM